MTRVNAAALLALGLFAPALSAQELPPPREAPTRIVLHVNGLACPICAYGVEKKLDALEATDSVKVDLDKGLVELTLRPSAAVADDILRSMVREAGFAVSRIERRTASGGAAAPPRR